MSNQHKQSAKITPRVRVLFWVLAVLVMICVFWFIKYLVSNSATNSANNHSQESTTTSATSNLQVPDAEVVAEQEIEDLDHRPDALMSGVEDLPRSLQGTQVDGEVIVDAQSDLVVTQGLRRLFDYFLSAQGEEEASAINARVESYIRSRTPEPAASQAIDLYYQYLSYLQQVANIEQKQNKSSGRLFRDMVVGGASGNKEQAGQALDLSAIEKQQQALQQLRSEQFDSQTVNTFFAEDDALYRYNIAMLQIAQDKKLTPVQKQQAQAAYVEQLPESTLKDHAKQQANIDQLLTRTQQMQAQGASRDELFAMRSQLVGRAAADRLAKLDAQQAAFDSRFNQYLQARERILASDSPKQVLQQQITQLQQQLFNEAEQKRLTGYEQFRQRSSTSN